MTDHIRCFEFNSSTPDGRSVDLSTPEELRASSTYSVLHIKRLDAAAEFRFSESDEQQWVSIAKILFTPRGVANSFAFLGLNGFMSSYRPNFRYSHATHVLHGVSSPLENKAAAFCFTFRLEQQLLSNSKLGRFLFCCDGAPPQSLALPKWSKQALVESLGAGFMTDNALIRSIHFSLPPTPPQKKIKRSVIAGALSSGRRNSSGVKAGSLSLSSSSIQRQEGNAHSHKPKAAGAMVITSLSLDALPSGPPPEEVNRREKLASMAPIATELLPELFVGGEMPSKNREELFRLRITTIVNAAFCTLSNEFPEDFCYVSLSLCDSPDESFTPLVSLVNRTISDTANLGGRTFVHCHQGVSRSVALSVAYLMWRCKWSMQRAMAYVRDRRTIASPNPGFIVALMMWERQLDLFVTQDGDPSLFMYRPYGSEYSLPFVLDPIRDKGEVDARGFYVSISFSGATFRAEYAAGPRCTPLLKKAAVEDGLSLLPFSFCRNAKFVVLEVGRLQNQTWKEIPDFDAMFDNIDEKADVYLRMIRKNAEQLKVLCSIERPIRKLEIEEQCELASVDADSEDDYDASDFLTVYAFPFTGTPIEFYGLEDLYSNQAYAFLSRGSKRLRRNHRIYFWRGRVALESQRDVDEAFEMNLVRRNIKISSKRDLRKIRRVDVLEGQEPDELLKLIG